MNKSQVEKLCSEKIDFLLKKYFGNLVKEAAIDCPETIGDYDLELPLRIEVEFRSFLEELWRENASDDKRTIDELLDKKELRDKMTEDDREGIAYAYRNAHDVPCGSALPKRIIRMLPIIKACSKNTRANCCSA